MYFMINNQLDEIYNLRLTSEIDILAVNKNRKTEYNNITSLYSGILFGNLLILFNFDLKF